MFYKYDLSLKLIQDYKSIVESLNPLLLQLHIEALSSKGIDKHVIESTFLDSNNPKYTKYNGLTFSIVPNMDIYNKHFKPQDEEQIEREYKLYNDYISKIQVSDFVESNLTSLFTVGTYDQETLTKIKNSSRGMFLEIDHFLHFYHQLCSYILGDYEYKHKKGGTVVYEKPLQTDYILSVKYNENDFKKELKLGHIRFPKLTFWVCHKSKKQDFFIGTIEHPFNKGLISPESYLANSLMLKIDSGSYDIMSPIELINNGNDFIIKPKERLNVNLKKHLTNYIGFENPFKKSILNYYEGITKEIIKSGNIEMLSKS